MTVIVGILKGLVHMERGTVAKGISIPTNPQNLWEVTVGITETDKRVSGCDEPGYRSL
jgi:hypothetical protein